MTSDETRAARMIGATDIVGSYSMCRLAGARERTLIASAGVDVFEQMLAQTAQKPGRREFEAKVRDRIDADPEPKGFIFTIILQVLLGIIIKALLEWLWNNYTANMG